jgi:hypothetical protein
MYKLENDLVSDFIKYFEAAECLFVDLKIAFEFDYQSGRVDVVGTNETGELISFEAKLSRWRDAVHQAYRNTSFSHYSYVILPEVTAKKAAMYWHEFDTRGIGLCVTSPNKVWVEIPATKQNPLLPWLTNKAIGYIYSGNSFFIDQPLCQTQTVPLF